MRFAIRDDDTNFFTIPEAIQNSYSDVWHLVPPSLCVITKVKGNWPDWVEHIYRHKQKTDWQAWERDNTVHPLDRNKDLVDFLKSCLQGKTIDVCFHAKHHRNDDATLPPEVESNYVRCAEYLTTKDRTKEIVEEIEYLSQLLNYKVSVFAPPQDLLSMEGYNSVLKAGLNVCGGGISFLKKQKDTRGVMNLLKQFSFKTIYPNEPYPYVLDYKTHREIPYYYPLLPDTTLDELIKHFEMVRRHDGDFVLSTHHAEFNYRMEYDNAITVKNVLDMFLEHISKYELSYVTLSQLLSKETLSRAFVIPMLS
ncbi:MAG TPA: hypothetical protein PL009_03175 [Flavipsychrobacter sp.]|nr:hypothetical protein [Flavipsychrobacter sp.]